MAAAAANCPRGRQMAYAARANAGSPPLQKSRLCGGGSCSVSAESVSRKVERAMGIEPTALAWEARVLPLYDARRAHNSTRETVFSANRPPFPAERPRRQITK